MQSIEQAKRKRTIKDNISSYLFLLPWFVILFVFTLYPFVEGIKMSLYEYTLRSYAFIGLDNFKELLADKQFWGSLLVTLKMVALIVPGTLIASLAVAYAIQDLSGRAKSFVKLVFYLSSIISQVALIMVWQWMFNPAYGMYTSLCNALGVVTVDLLGDTTYSIPLLSILVLFFTVSQPIVLFSAAFDNVPVSYYEAAELDGAGRLRKFFSITLPEISNVFFLVLVTTTINNIQVFVVPYLMTGGGPNGKTSPVLLLIYREAFEYGNYGYASAMGVVVFAIIAVFVAIQFKLQRKEG